MEGQTDWPGRVGGQTCSQALLEYTGFGFPNCLVVLVFIVGSEAWYLMEVAFFT